MCFCTGRIPTYTCIMYYYLSCPRHQLTRSGDGTRYDSVDFRRCSDRASIGARTSTMGGPARVWETEGVRVTAERTRFGGVSFPSALRTRHTHAA